MGVSTDKVGDANHIIALKCLSPLRPGCRRGPLNRYPSKPPKMARRALLEPVIFPHHFDFFLSLHTRKKQTQKFRAITRTSYNELSWNDVVLEPRIYMM